MEGHGRGGGAGDSGGGGGRGLFINYIIQIGVMGGAGG